MSNASVKSAFTKLRDLVPNELVFVIRKIMSISRLKSLGSQELSFNFLLLVAAKRDS